MRPEDAGKRVLLFYNPKAGNRMFTNNLDYIIERFQDAGLYLIPVRAESDVLDRVFENMDQSVFRQIIAAGGDGTLNVCVNAMVRHNIDLPLTICPAGTANDFAYYFDLPHEIEEMLDIALGDNYTYADVGTVNGKCFVNIAAMGMLVDVSQKTNPKAKNAMGTLAYYLKGLSEVPKLRPFRMKLTSEEYSGEEDMLFMLVMNGKSAGGFKNLSPSANINDGLLEVFLFRDMPITDFGTMLTKVVLGRHEEDKNVLYFHTKDLLIETDEDVPTDIDGEHGTAFPMRFGLMPKRLKVSTLESNMEGNSLKYLDINLLRRINL